jgi:PAS domain S-box-containing protein
MKLRSHILIITTTILLPLLAFVCIVLVLHFQSGRETQLQNFVATSRALSLALDKDFEARVAALKTLAQSVHLRDGDLKLFYEESKRVLPVHDGADAIVLVDSTGQQVTNTRRPFGEPLSQYSDPSFIKKLIEGRQPAVSNLFITRAVQRPIISVGVPVVVDSEAKYALTMSLSPVFIQRLLEQQAIPSQWLATIIDANKVIVARTRGMDKLLGKSASPSLSARSTENSEGWWIGTPSGSEPSYVAHRRSNFSGWVVAIAVPVSTVNRPLWQAIGFIVGGILFFLLVAIGIAILFWRRIVSSITALSGAAAALGKGEVPDIEPSPIVELEQIKKEFETVAAERKKDADQLNYERQLLQKITENVADSIFITDANGSVTFVNARAIATFGFSAEELLGQSLDEKIHDHQPDERPLSGSECALRQTATTSKLIRNHEDFFVKKDGTVLIVECTHVPLEVHGRRIGMVLIARDITERKRLLTEMEKRAAQRTRAD